VFRRIITQPRSITLWGRPLHMTCPFGVQGLQISCSWRMSLSAGAVAPRTQASAYALLTHQLHEAERETGQENRKNDSAASAASTIAAEKPLTNIGRQGDAMQNKVLVAETLRHRQNHPPQARWERSANGLHVQIFQRVRWYWRTTRHLTSAAGLDPLPMTRP